MKCTEPAYRKGQQQHGVSGRHPMRSHAEILSYGRMPSDLFKIMLTRVANSRAAQPLIQAETASRLGWFRQ